MASIKFLIQSNSDSASIHLRLSLSKNKSLKRKTGFYINSKNWSAKSGKPKSSSAELKNLSSELRGLSNYVLDNLNDVQKENVNIDGFWLERTIDGFFGRNNKESLDGLIVYGEHFIENLKFKSNDGKKLGLSVSTIKKYRTIVNKLIAFQAYKKKVYLVKDVNNEFRNDIIDYFLTIERLSDNTIGRYLKFIKTICIDAGKNGIETSSQLPYFQGFTVKVPKITLSFSELKTLAEFKFDNENYSIARDWLIIGCFTGQRVSDLLRMNKSFIKTIQNFDFIVLEQVKTNKLVQIPIHPEVRKILDKRGGEFPPRFVQNEESNKTLFNRYLKDMCKKAEINDIVSGKKFDEEQKRFVFGEYEKNELISSHICRRSFATNFYGDPKYPTPLLMNITAHSTEKMFLEYIGKKPIDYGLQLAKIWAEQSS
ncbi:phage integrase SAM-like domain-containing protein [Aegicerativicinus sediminis]|uniref:phage integrase SAM-like domain-containing protein n=1 Tax=Aegicerativicinus sediminis TaxID=2893202 RepID=UPI001E642689|nr:phage integrase SAM-like domain-containing protein [Aegicerativicinus sediminis]